MSSVAADAALHSDFMAVTPVDPREELERLERKHAGNPEGRFFVPLADARRRAGNPAGAIDLLRAGLQRHPDYLSAHIVLGRCYLDRGNPDAAEFEFRYVLSLDPQNLIALGTLGDLAAAEGRYDEAERWYLDLLAVDPMNEDARQGLEGLGHRDPKVSTSDAGTGDRSAESSDVEDVGASAPDAGTEVFDAPVAGENDQYPESMVDLTGDDGVEGGFYDEAVITETIAELYMRQGFHARAADVYRELIRRRGGDTLLEKKLADAEWLASGGVRGPEREAEAESGVEPEGETGAGAPSEAAPALNADPQSPWTEEAAESDAEPPRLEAPDSESTPAGGPDAESRLDAAEAEADAGPAAESETDALRLDAADVSGPIAAEQDDYRVQPESGSHEPEDRDLPESLYPLIGPVGEISDDDELDAVFGGEDDLLATPAYDFSTALPEPASQPDDDIGHLLIDPWAEPFEGPVDKDPGAGPVAAPDEPVGSAGGSWEPAEAPVDGSSADPFADSFSAGFAGLAPEEDSEGLDTGESAASTAETPSAKTPWGESGSGAPAAGAPSTESTTDTPSAETPTSGAAEASSSATATAESAPTDRTIGAFLRSVASWSRGSVAPEAMPPESGADDLTPGDLPPLPADHAGETTIEGLSWIGRELQETETTTLPDNIDPTEREDPRGDFSAGDPDTDFDFDLMLGYTPSADSTPADAGTADVAEPSGADDLHLVGGSDELFPWEIPAPEAAGDAVPSLPPLDLDQGYPFDDSARSTAPFADDTLHAERMPSEAVLPDTSTSGPASDGDSVDGSSAEAPDTGSEEEPSAPGSDTVPGDDAGESTTSPVASADDDDLESFQAWLRSLKR